MSVRDANWSYSHITNFQVAFSSKCLFFFLSFFLGHTLLDNVACYRELKVLQVKFNVFIHISSHVVHGSAQHGVKLLHQIGNPWDNCPPAFTQGHSCTTPQASKSCCLQQVGNHQITAHLPCGLHAHQLCILSQIIYEFTCDKPREKGYNAQLITSFSCLVLGWQVSSGVFFL